MALPENVPGRLLLIRQIIPNKNSTIPLLPYTPANQHDKRVEVLSVCLGHPLTRCHPPIFHLFMPIGYQLQRYPYLGKAFELDLSGIDALCKDVIHRVLLLITQEA